MSKALDAQGVAKAVGLSVTTVRVHRSDPTCPLSGTGMRRQRGGRRFVATAEVLSAYRAWLTELVPAGPSATGAA